MFLGLESPHDPIDMAARARRIKQRTKLLKATSEQCAGFAESCLT